MRAAPPGNSRTTVPERYAYSLARLRTRRISAAAKSGGMMPLRK